MATPSEIVDHVRRSIQYHAIFLDGVVSVFQKDPTLRTDPPVIHSLKSRVKDLAHLEEKIIRKQKGGQEITQANVFGTITDLAGVRVIHLHQAQFTPIHACIQQQVSSKDWILFEPPKAYMGSGVEGFL